VLDFNFKNVGVTVQLCLVCRIRAQESWTWVPLQKSGLGWTCSRRLEIGQPVSQKRMSKVSGQNFSFYSWLLGLHVFAVVDCLNRWNSCELVPQKVANENGFRLWSIHVIVMFSGVLFGDIDEGLAYERRNPVSMSWSSQPSVPSQWDDVGRPHIGCGQLKSAPNLWIDSARGTNSVPVTKVHLSTRIQMLHPFQRQVQGVPFHKMFGPEFQWVNSFGEGNQQRRMNFQGRVPFEGDVERWLNFQCRGLMSQVLVRLSSVTILKSMF
jgi:hypothetical protein